MRAKFIHRGRKAMVDYICGVGGYDRFVGESYAIEFNVAVDRIDLSFAHLWKTYSAEYIPEEVSASPELLYQFYCVSMACYKDFGPDALYEAGLEDARRSVTEDYEYSPANTSDGTRIPVELRLEGRGGKHLVIASFDGRNLRVSNDNLRRFMMEQQLRSGGYTSEYSTLKNGAVWSLWTTEEIASLYRYVRIAEEQFTPAAASKEVEYQAAFRLFSTVVFDFVGSEDDDACSSLRAAATCIGAGV